MECAICGKPFYTKRTFQKYCSSNCRRNAESFYQNREEIKKRCPICGNEFLTFKGHQKYCSEECYREAVKQRIQVTNNRYRPYLKMRFQIFERDKFRCQYCGRSISDGIKLEIDHIVPKSKLGQDELGNFITACSDCNLGKADILLLANKEGNSHHS